MSALRQELKNYIDSIPEKNLDAVKPILFLLATNYDPDFILEDDLTPEEEAIIEKGRKSPANKFMTLDEALKAIDESHVNDYAAKHDKQIAGMTIGDIIAK